MLREWVPVTRDLPRDHQRVEFWSAPAQKAMYGLFLGETAGLAGVELSIAQPRFVLDDGTFFGYAHPAEISHWRPEPKPPEYLL